MRKTGVVAVKNRIRLHKLCSRAVKETDPHKVAVLLVEIDDILSETLEEVSAMLKDLGHVLRNASKLRGST